MAGHSRPARSGARRWCWETPALGVLLTVAAALAGCTSSAATGPSRASPARSAAPAASTPGVGQHFTSRHDGYTEALLAGWTGGQATQRWDGTGRPGDEDSVVDLFQGPGGVEARVVAAPAKKRRPGGSPAR